MPCTWLYRYRHIYRIFLLTVFVLPSCAGNKTMVQKCADLTKEMHPIVAVPLLLTGCIGAAVADEIGEAGKFIAGVPVGVASQVYGNLSGEKEPGPSPFHGNWCGPGHPPKGTKPEPAPIDELDRLCQNHDKCYEKHGYYNCRCDVLLIRDIQKSNSMPSDIAQKAALVTEYFSNSYCMGCKQVKSGWRISYACHKPEEFGCTMGPVSRQKVYAWCP